MNRRKAIFMAHWWDNRWPMLIFWSVLIAATVVAYIINYSLEGHVVIGAFLAPIIFFMVTGSLAIKGMLHVTLGFGGTRKEFLGATVLFYLLYAGVNSLILVMLGFVEIEWLNNESIQIWFNMMDLQIARPDVVWLIQTLVFIDVLLLFAMMSSLQVRLGVPIYLSILVLVTVNLSMPATRTFWFTVGKSIYAYENLLQLIIGLVAAGALLTLIIWLLLARVSVKTSRA